MTKEEILQKVSAILGLKKILTESELEETLDLVSILKKSQEKA